jgi:pimeloyl-ACP methyl ester carboxylesterase
VSTFALVPGAWHGAWCFSTLAQELETLGHSPVAVDLESDRPDAALTRLAKSVAAASPVGDGDLIVVGHSFSGVVIPLVAKLRPVAALVFLAAFVPRPGVSVDEEFETGGFRLAPGAGEGRATDDQGRTYWTDRERAIELLYHDCEPSQAEAAVARLRPQGQRAAREPNPLAGWPDVRSEYVLCTEDRMFDREFQSEMAARLDVEPVAIDGGHSPFLSRPRELATLLDSFG